MTIAPTFHVFFFTNFSKPKICAYVVKILHFDKNYRIKAILNK